MQPLRCQVQRAGLTFAARTPTHTAVLGCRRVFSTAPASRPWFVDPESDNAKQLPPHLLPKAHEFPPNLPVPIKELFTNLSQSPLLEPSTLDVKEPTPIAPGPPLPKTVPKGRRKRGRTYSGEGIAEEQGGIWSWIVTAQVKEGTENRGSIEAVVRLVRKTLLKMDPPVTLSPNSKRRGHHGWAMVDAGNFAVHILSGEARRKYFLNQSQW
ncbi:hypothetical protein BU15DRAFT_39587 [Melanogaster broomeanus]|nr:hypothetical protein BU15DRAFT_39587 [Melanogaster broomeanus]